MSLLARPLTRMSQICGTWPPPASNFAGTEVRRDMKRKRNSPLVRLILAMLLVGTIEFAVGGATSRNAWAKPVPVESLGDPTIGEDAPKSGPAKAAKLSAFTMASTTGVYVRPVRRPQRLSQVLLIWRQYESMIRMSLR